MKSLKFNSFLAINVYNKNKVFTARKECDLIKGDFFIATLKNGFEFAICKVKSVKQFKNFEFLDEFDAVEFKCKNAEKIQVTKQQAGFKDFKQLQKFYNNYFDIRKMGFLVLYDVVFKLCDFNFLKYNIEKINTEEEKQTKKSNDYFEECKNDPWVRTCGIYLEDIEEEKKQ
jgi:hypothetical protein